MRGYKAVTLNTKKPTREERAAMSYDQLLRAVWLLDDIIESKRWVPVKERLPEKGIIDPISNDYVEYLCTLCVDGKNFVRLVKYDCNGHWVYWGTNFDKNVVAWMPKPETYKNNIV